MNVVKVAVDIHTHTQNKNKEIKKKIITMNK